MKKLHLICNAHLDPMWQWEWEEGAVAAVATFRCAADFCEEFDSFVFNHNEVILYKWIEEYEPKLFEKIVSLVKKGKWNIMGGWYLQPDCNMPSGESFIRQILVGRQYFKNKFGVTPTTAINFDAFGHSRGLVQIMVKSGYDSYLFMRPFTSELALPEEEFVWEGYDSSTILVHRVFGGYNTLLGRAGEKIKIWLDQKQERNPMLLLWGVGNHGGGPSRQDIINIGKLSEELKVQDIDIIHSTPEKYFHELKQKNDENKKTIPVFNQSLRHTMTGCYTSQVRIKQKHRELENLLFSTEKIASAASLYGVAEYPNREFEEAQECLLLSQFHDILPGSSIQSVEEMGLRVMEKGIDILSKVRARMFFTLTSGQPKAEDDTIPILVYNPHPYKINTTIVCEFQLADQCYEDCFISAIAYHNGKALLTQIEKEHSNIPIEWRKRVVFDAELTPTSMNRFDCKLIKLTSKPLPCANEEKGAFVFDNKNFYLSINLATGLIDSYVVNGREFFKDEAAKLIVINDNEDPWGMSSFEYRDIAGEFKLASKKRASEVMGLKHEDIEPVHIIEDGDVRSVVEAVFEYNNSTAVLTYTIPKNSEQIEINVRVFWNEKDKMLKLSFPTNLLQSTYIGQDVYGIAPLDDTGRENVSQKWSAVLETDGCSVPKAMTFINDGIYSSDFLEGEARVTLLRSAAYTAHPIENRTTLPQDRFSPRIDQGERQFRIWFCGGNKKERLNNIDREALNYNETPFALSFFPSGEGKLPENITLSLEGDTIVMPAFKLSEDKEGYIVRLFNPMDLIRSSVLHIPFLGVKEKISFQPFEIKTYKIMRNGELVSVNLIEELL